MEDIYSVKMRASQKSDGKSVHISGAERMVPFSELGECIDGMTKRALNHPKGSPDDLNIKVEKINIDDILTVPALNTVTVEVESKEEGRDYLIKFLKNRSVENAEAIVGLLASTKNMSGAVLLDMRTLKSLEKDHSRGIRVTNMDYKNPAHRNIISDKSHYREALALASKVVSCPQIWGELCISDDPDYVTGYIATKQDGYTRITKLKEKGVPRGARIFLYQGRDDEIDECIEYLTEKKVWIDEENI